MTTEHLHLWGKPVLMRVYRLYLKRDVNGRLRAVYRQTCEACGRVRSWEEGTD